MTDFPVGCFGKTPHRDPHAASVELKRILKRIKRGAGIGRRGTPKDGLKLEVYRCPRCQHWHVGNYAQRRGWR